MKDSEQSKTWYEELILTLPAQQRQNWYSEVAEAYNRVRPRYPQQLIDRAIAISQIPQNGRILEIGCGPGTATVEFAKRGYSMVSLEPSLDACQIARRNCDHYPQVEIQNTTFEAWELQSQHYHAVLAATSFHWVSPKVGYRKAAETLKDGGSLILLWNAEVQPKDEIYQHLRQVYQSQVPSLAQFHDQQRNSQQEGLRKIGQGVIDSGLFGNWRSEQFIQEITYSVADYLALLRTYSPYIRLEVQQRESLLASLRETLDRHWGKDIPATYLSMFQIFTQKAV